MTVRMPSEQEVVREVVEVLLEHLSPDKVARFWSALSVGAGDYLAIREQLFTGETVATLYDKVQAYQAKQE